MKIILIEDEPESLMGMKRAIETIDMDFSLFISSYAEQALHIIQEEWPDLIVTDIMLPDMTGLDLVEQVTGREYNPMVIVISGYSDFEYARRSLRVGAADYLLKPFSTEEFVSKIQKALIAIQESNVYLLETNAQKTFAEIGNRSMRDEYLTDFCLKRTPNEGHLYQKLTLWGIEWLANQSYSLLVFDRKGYPEGKPIGREFSLQTFAIGNIVQELLPQFAPSLLFKDPQNRWVLISGVEDVDDLSRKVIAALNQYQKMQLSMGISSKMTAFEDIHTAYNEALRAFRLNSLSDCSEYFYQGNHEILMSTDSSSPSIMSSLLLERQEDQIEAGVHEFIRHAMFSEDTFSREDMIRNILNYLSQIHVCLSEATSKELEEIPMKVWESFDECRTLEESEKVLCEYLITLSHELSPPKSNALVERALQTIATRYMEDLTLKVIADELSLHPVWLSQLIKKDTGQTYLDHLTERRIEKAKALLRETSLKIYEIAELVGYHDLQHFGNLFKKRTGQTPKEYRYGK
ncbi:response regulator [Paenibacillus frigoriresistens]|uniref:response regulator n=1 Tax=Paenibacillus alginolyticus TaxID=59839 RepID=UPI001565CD8B|nr:response regulator [Paenibacillus frigoriresistens]NRF92827.1 response regulator [Paenibacillus frigoriresistens]